MQFLPHKNALCLHYKDQVVDAILENNYCFVKSYTTHPHTLQGQNAELLTLMEAII
jgi:hypothetical protein